jgi:hypothetical protein
MTDHASGNPHWASATGRGVPAVPPPDRDAPAVTASGPTRSVASWLGWCPTSWRSESEATWPPRPAGGSGL